MQRLGAIIFQILGMILLKLWAMLNLDCISKNTVNTIAQINAALAGITDLIGTVDTLAINFSDNSADLWQAVKDSIKNMKQQLEEQAQKVWDDMSNVGEQFKAAGKDIAETYSNPAAYLAAVPPEIRNSISEDINAINDLKQNILSMQTTINNITNRNGKIQNDTPRGVETMVFSN
jgi:gas vesicle protein